MAIKEKSGRSYNPNNILDQIQEQNIPDHPLTLDDLPEDMKTDPRPDDVVTNPRPVEPPELPKSVTEDDIIPKPIPDPEPDPIDEPEHFVPKTVSDLEGTELAPEPPIVGTPTTAPELDPAFSSLTQRQLDQACDYLLQSVQSHVRDGVKAQAAMLRIPTWQLVAGLLVHAHQSGGLAQPSLDPSWRSENPIALSNQTCPECKKQFEAKWRNQVYCSDACGLAVEKRRNAEIRERNRALEKAETMAAMSGLEGDESF